MATLLVIGASRGIGLETVKRALAAGHRVRAFARGAASIAARCCRRWKNSPAMRSTRRRVAAAVAGADAVIQSLGAPKACRPLLSGTTLFSQATRILIDAMRETGVRRLVTVTGLGAGDSRGHGSFLYDAILFPLDPEARLRRQGRAGADDQGERPRVDHRPARTADERPGDGPGARAGRPARIGAPAPSAAPTSPISSCARPSSAASSARRRCSSDEPLGRAIRRARPTS